MSMKFYADLPYMQNWAEQLIASREPDFIIGANYLRRWWVIPRNHMQNVYLHEINLSDDARAMHDHPWDNISVILKGSYIEHTPEESYIRNPGDSIHRSAFNIHRLEVAEGAQVISLFITGPVLRDWGFHCPKGFVPWQDFVGIEGNQSTITGGCGEYA